MAVDAEASIEVQYALGIMTVVGVGLFAAGLSWWPRLDPVLTGVAAWAVSAIGAKMTQSDGVLQQGSGYAHFNTNTLSSCATALFVFAGVLGLGSLSLTVWAAMSHNCWWSYTSPKLADEKVSAEKLDDHKTIDGIIGSSDAVHGDPQMSSHGEAEDTKCIVVT